MYVSYQCLGPGKLRFGSLFAIEPCDGEPGTVTLRGQAGVHAGLKVEVADGTRWRVLVEEPR